MQLPITCVWLQYTCWEQVNFLFRWIHSRQLLLTLANPSCSHTGDHFSLCRAHTTAGRDQAGNRDVDIIFSLFSILYNFSDSLMKNMVHQLFISEVAASCSTGMVKNCWQMKDKGNTGGEMKKGVFYRKYSIEGCPHVSMPSLEEENGKIELFYCLAAP